MGISIAIEKRQSLVLLMIHSLLLLVGGANAAGQEEHGPLVVSNSSKHAIVFYSRPVSLRTIGPESFVSTTVAPDRTAEISLPALDYYDVQVRLADRGGEESSSAYRSQPADLIRLARAMRGRPVDLRLALAMVPLPNGGTNAHVAQAELGGISLSDKSDVATGLMNSRWETTYLTEEGRPVRATIELNPHGSRYITPDFVGNLEKVVICRGKGAYTVQGAWNAGQAKGVFAFDITGDRLDRLSGGWKFSGKDEWHDWRGTRRK